MIFSDYGSASITEFGYLFSRIEYLVTFWSETVDVRPDHAMIFTTEPWADVQNSLIIGQDSTS